MKKIVSLLLVGIISVTSFASWVSASWYRYNTSVAEVNAHIESSDGYQVQWKWWFLVKYSMKVTAIILRWAGDIAEYWARKAWLTQREVMEVLNNRHKIADALDKMAEQADIISYNIRFVVAQKLSAAWLSWELAWAAAGVVEVLAF